jgi:hypothetical protein
VKNRVEEFLREDERLPVRVYQPEQQVRQLQEWMEGLRVQVNQAKSRPANAAPGIGDALEKFQGENGHLTSELSKSQSREEHPSSRPRQLEPMTRQLWESNDALQK